MAKLIIEIIIHFSRARISFINKTIIMSCNICVCFSVQNNLTHLWRQMTNWNRGRKQFDHINSAFSYTSFQGRLAIKLKLRWSTYNYRGLLYSFKLFWLRLLRRRFKFFEKKSFSVFQLLEKKLFSFMIASFPAFWKEAYQLLKKKLLGRKLLSFQLPEK